MHTKITNTVPEPEVWNSIRKDAKALSSNSNVAAALLKACKNGGYQGTIIGKKLGLIGP